MKFNKIILGLVTITSLNFLNNKNNKIDNSKTIRCITDDSFYLMTILPSTIKGAGLGTFATQFIPANTDLGKYYGDILINLPTNTDYTWTILDKDKLGNIIEKYVDGINYKENNPLRYVNAPKNQQEKHIINTKMIQIGVNVHYITTRSIYKGEELFIDYGDSYWTFRNIF